MRIDHVALAVPDLDAAARALRDACAASTR